MVTVKVNPPSGTIVLDRPDHRNALSTGLLGEIKQAFQDLYQEKRVRGVILIGAGSDFCAGVDLEQFHQVSQLPESIAFPQWQELWETHYQLLEEMLRYPKPIVAAVEGVALGVGFAMVLASDLVVASRTSHFGGTAVRRGLLGGTVAPLLNWKHGGAIAARLLLMGEMIGSAEAYRLGLTLEPVEPNQIWARAHHLCEQFALAPREAIQFTKRLLNETLGESVLSQLRMGVGMGAACCTTEAAAEGLRAFAEKREARWP
jgi:enoyl-CoA hydratase/carnithine racemase